MSKIKIIFLGFILFLGIFSGSYRIAGFVLYPRLLISMFGFLSMFINRNIPKYIVSIIILTSIFLIFVLISFVLRVDLILHFVIGIKFVFKALIISLGIGLYLYRFLKKNNMTRVQLSYSILWIVLFQTITILLQILNDDFRKIFFSVIVLDDHWMNLARMDNFRAVGVAGLSIWDTAIAYSLLFGSTLYLLKDGSKGDKMIWILLFVIFFVLIAVSGRSGLMIFLFLSFLVIFSQKRSCNFVIRILSVLFFIVLIMFYCIDFSVIKTLVLFAFDFFINGLNVASTKDLTENHLYLPLIDNYVFGEGVWQTAKDIKPTDSGFILVFIYLGLPGFLLVILFCILFTKTYYNIFSISIKHNLSRKIMLFIISLFVIFFVLKGPLYFSEKFITSLVITMIVFGYYEKTKNKHVLRFAAV